MILKLLTAPITAPGAGFKFILKQLQTMADRELYDEDRLREELLLLQLRLEEGEITEDEYLQQEAQIIAQLREARARRQGASATESAPADDRARG